jgi:hypothetical protein
MQVTEEIENFLKSLQTGEIPESWQDLCYPTMDDLDGFLVMFSSESFHIFLDCGRINYWLLSYKIILENQLCCLTK